MKKPEGEGAAKPSSLKKEEGGAEGVELRTQADTLHGKRPPEPNESKAEPTVRKRKHGFRERFQRFMTAAAFAESGESDTALEIAYSHPKNVQVLLAVNGTDVSKEAVHYCGNLCVRMSAGLVVLFVAQPKTAEADELVKRDEIDRSQRIQSRIRQSTGLMVSVKALTASGKVDEEVYSYAKTNKNVAVIVFDTNHLWGNERQHAKWVGIFHKLSRRLAIPMVTTAAKGPVGAC